MYVPKAAGVAAVLLPAIVFGQGSTSPAVSSVSRSADITTSPTSSSYLTVLGNDTVLTKSASVTNPTSGNIYQTKNGTNSSSPGWTGLSTMSNRAFSSLADIPTDSLTNTMAVVTPSASSLTSGQPLSFSSPTAAWFSTMSDQTFTSLTTTPTNRPSGDAVSGLSSASITASPPDSMSTSTASPSQSRSFSFPTEISNGLSSMIATTGSASATTTSPSGTLTATSSRASVDSLSTIATNASSIGTFTQWPQASQSDFGNVLSSLMSSLPATATYASLPINASITINPLSASSVSQTMINPFQPTSTSLNSSESLLFTDGSSRSLTTSIPPIKSITDVPMLSSSTTIPTTSIVANPFSKMQSNSTLGFTDGVPSTTRPTDGTTLVSPPSIETSLDNNTPATSVSLKPSGRSSASSSSSAEASNSGTATTVNSSMPSEIDSPAPTIVFNTKNGTVMLMYVGTFSNKALQYAGYDPDMTEAMCYDIGLAMLGHKPAYLGIGQSSYCHAGDSIQAMRRRELSKVQARQTSSNYTIDVYTPVAVSSTDSSSSWATDVSSTDVASTTDNAYPYFTNLPSADLSSPTDALSFDPSFPAAISTSDPVAAGGVTTDNMLSSLVSTTRSAPSSGDAVFSSLHTPSLAEASSLFPAISPPMASVPFETGSVTFSSTPLPTLAPKISSPDAVSLSSTITPGSAMISQSEATWDSVAASNYSFSSAASATKASSTPVASALASPTPDSSSSPSSVTKSPAPTGMTSSTSLPEMNSKYINVDLVMRLSMVLRQPFPARLARLARRQVASTTSTMSASNEVGAAYIADGGSSSLCARALAWKLTPDGQLWSSNGAVKAPVGARSMEMSPPPPPPSTDTNLVPSNFTVDGNGYLIWWNPSFAGDGIARFCISMDGSIWAVFDGKLQLNSTPCTEVGILVAVHDQVCPAPSYPPLPTNVWPEALRPSGAQCTPVTMYWTPGDQSFAPAPTVAVN